jgi:hypothetical protein
MVVDVGGVNGVSLGSDGSWGIVMDAVGLNGSLVDVECGELSVDFAIILVDGVASSVI